VVAAERWQREELELSGDEHANAGIPRRAIEGNR
jgi:hypothetical protein